MGAHGEMVELKLPGTLLAVTRHTSPALSAPGLLREENSLLFSLRRFTVHLSLLLNVDSVTLPAKPPQTAIAVWEP